MVFDISLEMQSDSKTYANVQDDEITDRIKYCTITVHNIKSACACRKFTLHRQLEILNELLPKASFEPNEKMRCLFGMVKRF